MNINTSDGWVKLHRSIMNHAVYQNNNTFLLFTGLLLMAHHEDDFASIRFKGKQTYLKRGQLSISRSELAERYNLPLSTVRDCIYRLRDDELVLLESDNKTTVFTICNYVKYQQQDDHKKTTGRIRRRQLTPDYKEVRSKKISTNVDMSFTNDSSGLFEELLSDLGFTSKVRLTKGRLRLLKDRLKTYSAKELGEAAKALAADPFMQGDNKSGKRYGTIDYLLRNDENVDKYLNAEQKTVTYKADW